MKSLNLKSEFFRGKKLSIQDKDFSSIQLYSPENPHQNNETYSLINEIKNILKEDLELNDLINQVINKIQNLIQLKCYSIAVYIDNKIVFEKSDNFKKSIIDYLINSGVIKLSLDEKRSLTIASPENSLRMSNSKIIIIPILGHKNEYVIFIIEIRENEIEIVNKFFPILEMIFYLVGQTLLRILLEIQYNNFKKILDEEIKMIFNELNYATVGLICTKSFHNLKNKTQVVISAFNLLQKFISKEEERVNKVFEILEREIPEFSKIIKSLSELSKIIITSRKPNYIELQKLLMDTIDYLDLIEITKGLKIKIEKISRSKIFGNYEIYLQAFLLIFFELNLIGIKEIEVITNEDEFRLNVDLKSKLEPSQVELKNLLEVNTNIKFVHIKKLFKQNSCTVLTNYSTDTYDIMISIPKRSSQFSKVTNYAKDFNS